jgi:UDP-N-acetylmuramoyl-tripeptide--D-alanyl-D-alanine ligase
MIGSWTLSGILPLLAGQLQGPDSVFSGVTTDSRKIKPGDLFVALRGERFDGHDFVAGPGLKVAAGALVERKVSGSVSQLCVEDTVTALGQLGRINRQRFNGKVIAITGSNGKTTVKEMLASILSGNGRVCRTEGNLNNHLGVPISLLRLSAEDQFGVFELGANHAGEIAYTVDLVDPDIAVLNNAGDAHLEGFGSHQGIAAAKGEIITGLASGGTVILNHESPYFGYWCGLAGERRVLSFGLENDADVFATNIAHFVDHTVFELHLNGAALSVSLPFAGIHNVLNALAATAAASALGIGLLAVAEGLGAARSLGGRLRQVRTQQGALVIDDTYNASPASMKAALDVLAGFAGQRIAVLGHMAELGDYAVSSHREIGQYARGRTDQLWVMGRWAKDYADGFGPDCRILSGIDEAIGALEEVLGPHTTVLVKGSRSAAMDKVVKGITANNNNTDRSKA